MTPARIRQLPLVASAIHICVASSLTAISPYIPCLAGALRRLVARRKVVGESATPFIYRSIIYNLMMLERGSNSPANQASVNLATMNLELRKTVAPGR